MRETDRLLFFKQGQGATVLAGSFLFKVAVAPQLAETSSFSLETARQARAAQSRYCPEQVLGAALSHCAAETEGRERAGRF